MTSMLNNCSTILSLSVDCAIVNTVYSGSRNRLFFRVFVLESCRIGRRGFILIGRFHFQENMSQWRLAVCEKIEFPYKSRGSAIHPKIYSFSRPTCFRRPLGTGDQESRLYFSDLLSVLKYPTLYISRQRNCQGRLD